MGKNTAKERGNSVTLSGCPPDMNIALRISSTCIIQVECLSHNEVLSQSRILEISLATRISTMFETMVKKEPEREKNSRGLRIRVPLGLRSLVPLHSLVPLCR